MVFKIYPYLGEVQIAIDAPKNILDRVEANIDEAPLDGIKYNGIVRAYDGELRTIVRDKTAKYLSTRQNGEMGVDGCDYIRYKTHVQTIWRMGDLDYVVRNHLPNDESGVSKCFKKIYYSLPASQNKTLIHAAAIDVAQSGVLMVGKKRSGKTTLAFNMIDQMNAALVEGGTSLISFDGQLRVHYLPRPIFARFATIANSPYLSTFLHDIEKTESQQPWDLEAIEDIIQKKAFSVDGGLNFSRRVFRQLSGKKTLTTSAIKTIIFPAYSEGSKVKIESVSVEDAYQRLSEREFEIGTALGKMQDQNNIEHPENSVLTREWLSGVNLKAISFDGDKDLTAWVLEDLLA